MTHAIPTRYAGVQFRSRLEARWAAFFDLVGWRWEYEPLDLAGYIPDFIVTPPSPMPATLVEVKPIAHWPCPVTGCVGCEPHDADTREPHDAALAKLASSIWGGPELLLGAVLMPPGQLGVPRIGRLVAGSLPEPNLSCISNDLALFRCQRCSSFQLSLDIPRDVAWISACCGGSPIPSEEVNPTLLWREAGNRVQWNAPEGGR